MKTRRILLLALCALCLAGFNLKAQENTTYYYRVIVTTSPEEGGTPLAYLPVYMSRGKAPDEIIAVRMTDRAGQAWFINVPIDIYKDYIFTLPFKDGELRYLRSGDTEEPSFKGGNRDNPIWIDSGKKWETSAERTPGKDVGKITAFDWIMKEFPNIGIDGTIFYDKQSEATLQLMLNGYFQNGDEMPEVLKVLKKMPAKYLDSAKLSLLTTPNEYYAGALDVTIHGQGEPELAYQYDESLPIYEE